MIYKNKTIKAVALATLFTLTGPMHAFNVWDMWTNFKQNSQAKIAAGFAAAAATAAAVTYWAYNKYRTNTPAPVIKKPVLNNVSSGSAAYHSKQISANPNMDSKHTRERAEAEMDTLGNLVAKKPEVSRFCFPSYCRNERSSAYLSALQNKQILPRKEEASHADKKHTLERAQAEMDTLGNFVAPTRSVSTASGSQMPMLPRTADGGGMSSKPATVESPIKASKEHTELSLNNVGDSLSNMAIRDAQNDLAAEKTKLNALQQEQSAKIAPLIDGMHARLVSITRTLLRKSLTERDIKMQLEELETIREELFSFNVIGTDLDQLYSANFACVSHMIKPKEAYNALYTLGIIQLHETAKSIDTETIRKRIQKKRNELTPESDSFKALRQLDYIFRNDVTRAKYDAYIQGLPVLSTTEEIRDHVAKTIEKLKGEALNIQATLRKKQQDKKWNEEYELVDVLGRKNPTVSTSTTRVDLGEKPLTINARSLVHPEASESSMAAKVKQAIEFIQAKMSPTAASASAAAPADDSKGAQGTEENLMSKAGRMASATASTAASLASTAASSVASAATAAGVAILARVSPTASPAASEVEQRPVVIIDRSEKVAQENQSDVAAAPQPQPASAEVDPLSAAPYPENHIQASPSKPAPVINAGKSIV